MHFNCNISNTLASIRNTLTSTIWYLVLVWYLKLVFVLLSVECHVGNGKKWGFRWGLGFRIRTFKHKYLKHNSVLCVKWEYFWGSLGMVEVRSLFFKIMQILATWSVLFGFGWFHFKSFFFLLGSQVKNCWWHIWQITTRFLWWLSKYLWKFWKHSKSAVIGRSE